MKVIYIHNAFFFVCCYATEYIICKKRNKPIKGMEIERDPSRTYVYNTFTEPVAKAETHSLCTQCIFYFLTKNLKTVQNSLLIFHSKKDEEIIVSKCKYCSTATNHWVTK